MGRMTRDTSWRGTCELRSKAHVCLGYRPYDCTDSSKKMKTLLLAIWVVVKIMVPFWILIIIRHLIFRVPKKRP